MKMNEPNFFPRVSQTYSGTDITVTIQSRCGCLLPFPLDFFGASFISPPGVIGKFFGDTWTKKVLRKEKNAQRLCSFLNKRHKRLCSFLNKRHKCTDLREERRKVLHQVNNDVMDDRAPEGPQCDSSAGSSQ